MFMNNLLRQSRQWASSSLVSSTQKCTTQRLSLRTNQWRSFTENKKASGFAGVLAADNAEFTVKVHHLTSYGLAVLTPAALILSPSMLNVPVDLALGCLIPIHSHIGMNGVISDYIPKPMQGSVRLVWMGITSIVFFGILRLNIQGPGFTESIKSIWREPEEKK